ncbi:MAG TPA: tetratricopeptide repeat protein, partial [Actinomycetota bacterium]|nr:tetratricopeptide repeat protein [Actinomycetota bacterium]
CYINLGRPQRALELLGEVSRADGEARWARAQVARAKAYAATGDRARAEELLRSTEHSVKNSRFAAALRRAREELA